MDPLLPRRRWIFFFPGEDDSPRRRCWVGLTLGAFVDPKALASAVDHDEASLTDLPSINSSPTADASHPPRMDDRFLPTPWKSHQEGMRPSRRRHRHWGPYIIVVDFSRADAVKVALSRRSQDCAAHMKRPSELSAEVWALSIGPCDSLCSPRPG